MDNLKNQIEALLFLSNKPLDIKKITELTERKKTEIETVLAILVDDYNKRDSGIGIMCLNDSYQMVTDKRYAQVVEKFLKQELTGEMTRPQLEALTIVAYRQPITKMELEQIRGVNCSLILRNLEMRGLIEKKHDKNTLADKYFVTVDFMKFLGITTVEELPDYEGLSQHENIETILEGKI
jgi:segregation and condensation protein B